ncbi:glycerophosphodiester phosphodiesterase [Cytobacillus purgationiresistens]|uniref:Glycerophosphoryl diester phosphodiesterase n=1 Tax=Cytobacillus purgationiresistens TaxID=863449 RepID=A0ABU0AKD7_9BACI|nr:glycerophosphodiester phosphodiesterase family protein [Cytobacillus purgationiresistens]MDQ0270843.1 glycerophosphoryl diester phosphodiesterase [Cytobacillus purgationiresistens]
MKLLKTLMASTTSKLSAITKTKQPDNHPYLFKKIAHRGAAGYCPENTFAAFDQAIAMGADYLELDIQLTKDKQMVVIHDPTIDRTTNGKGRVKDYTFAELQKFDAGSWFSQEFKNERVPLFKDVLARYLHRVGLLIEFKKPSSNEGIEKKLAEELIKLPLDQFDLQHIIVQSFDLESLMRMHAHLPQIPIGLLINYPLHKQEIIRFSNQVQYLNPKWSMVTPKLLKAIHDEGMHSFIWTVNTPREFNKVKGYPIDGIVTNDLDLFQQEKG